MSNAILMRYVWTAEYINCANSKPRRVVVLSGDCLSAYARVREAAGASEQNIEITSLTRGDQVLV